MPMGDRIYVGDNSSKTVAAHAQKIRHEYLVHYPDHAPRKGDPHYRDFEEYRRRTKDTAQCDFGTRRGDYAECQGPLELHHAHVEFALANAVNLTWLEKDYEGISDPDSVGAWIESAANLIWLCRAHHRGPGGVHTASASDYEAERYVTGLISEG